MKTWEFGVFVLEDDTSTKPLSNAMRVAVNVTDIAIKKLLKEGNKHESN